MEQFEQSPQDMQQDAMMQAPEDAGRGTDTVMAHMSLGEIVIPRAFQDDPQVMEMLKALFESAGANIAEFTVGDPANKINPETGYPEFGFFKSLGKIFKIAAPLALSVLAPGLGTAIGGSLLGAGAAGSATLGSGLLGAGLGAATGGGLKGALTGGVLGGVGANLGSFGSNVQGPTQSGASLGSGTGILGSIGDNAIGRGIGDFSNSLSNLGNSVGSSVGSLPNSLQGPTQSGASLGSGSGILGKVGGATGLSSSAPSLGGALTGSAGGGGSSFSPLSTAANIFGGLNQDAAIKKQQKQLLGANQQQLANLESFDPSNITNDAGYQFNLQQGQEGLNKGLAAGGSLYSGKALKAASEYNQNYANNAFNAAYQRWLQKTQGQNAIYGNTGDVQAQATGAGAQNINQSLSNALGAPVGQYGQGNMTLEQLRKLGLAV